MRKALINIEEQLLEEFKNTTFNEKYNVVNFVVDDTGYLEISLKDQEGFGCTEVVKIIDHDSTSLNRGEFITKEEKFTILKSLNNKFSEKTKEEDQKNIEFMETFINDSNNWVDPSTLIGNVYEIYFLETWRHAVVIDVLMLDGLEQLKVIIFKPRPSNPNDITDYDTITEIVRVDELEILIGTMQLPKWIQGKFYFVGEK